MTAKTKTAKISKAELIELLVSDSRVFQSARYYARYSVAELTAMVEAYGYSDLHCRAARDLFDAAGWSYSLRTNKRLRTRSEGLTGRPAAILK
jgi:hypothetical protein